MTAVDAAMSVLVPMGTPVVMVPGTRAAASVVLPALGHGEQLVFLDGRRLGVRRVRVLARDAGLVVDKELVVIPSLREPSFVVEDSVESMRWFWNAFATVPPGRSTGSLLLTAATRLGNHRSLLRWVGRLVPGRMVVAHRP